jgi:hypothetical protein
MLLKRQYDVPAAIEEDDVDRGRVVIDCLTLLVSVPIYSQLRQEQRDAVN